MYELLKYMFANRVRYFCITQPGLLMKDFLCFSGTTLITFNNTHKTLIEFSVFPLKNLLYIVICQFNLDNSCSCSIFIVPDSVGGYSLFVSFVCLFVCLFVILSVCLSVCLTFFSAML